MIDLEQRHMHSQDVPLATLVRDAAHFVGYRTLVIDASEDACRDERDGPNASARAGARSLRTTASAYRISSHGGSRLCI